MRIKSILFALYLFVTATAFAGNGFSIKTIVLDAGHGGKDPGATGPGKTNEKDVALKVVLKLGALIQKEFPDVNVIYTRKTDVFIELHERADIANKSKADLFMAVHCNSSTSPATYGTSTYVLGLHRTEANLEVAKRENAVILMEDDRDKNYDFNPNSPEGHIMMSMKQNAFLDQSIDMASKIESQFETSAKRKSLGVKQAGFYVIYKTAMPSLLSEIGFISNADEEKFLNSAKGQDVLATSLFKAFKDYKFQIENSEGEQFAYEQARKKALEDAENEASRKPGYKKEAVELDVNGAPLPKETVVKEEKKEETVKTTTTTTTTAVPSKKEEKGATTAPAKKEDKPVTTTNSTTTSTQPATTNDPTVVTLSGRKIRKPIENSSGGGSTTSAEPAEPAKTETAAKTEPVKEKEKPKTEKTTVKTTTKTTSTTEVEKPVVKKENEDKPVKLETADNSSAPAAPVEKTVTKTKTETKTVAKTTQKTEAKTEPKVETKTEVKEEPKKEIVAEPEAARDTKTASKEESKSEEKIEPKSESKKPAKTEVKSETKTETKTVTKSEPKSEPKMEVKSEAKKAVEKPKPVVSEEKPVKSKPTVTVEIPEISKPEGVVYKVQFIALKGPFREFNKVMQTFPNISKEEVSNGFVRYYSCSVKSYDEAKQHLTEAVSAGYKDAFVVGYRNGTRLSPKETEGLRK